ncbi:MAG: hydrogenase [Bacteroidota bacterium]|nr:hydrogenase [Bacteroidota bacterium]
MNTLKIQHNQSNKLIFLGVLLFFLGLIVGLTVPLFANPRMGLSSHLEGIMNGIFLIVLGLIWYKIDVTARWLRITFWLAIYGTFANWFGILIAAIFNAGKMLNVAAEGQEGPAFAEGIVTFSLISLTLAMLAVCVIVLIGLGRQMRKN